jgi:hypothetical protein
MNTRQQEIVIMKLRSHVTFLFKILLHCPSRMQRMPRHEKAQIALLEKLAYANIKCKQYPKAIDQLRLLAHTLNFLTRSYGRVNCGIHYDDVHGCKGCGTTN